MNFLIRHLSQTRIVLIKLCTLVLILNSSIASAATLTSTVNRNSMSTNETLRLVVSIDEKVDSSQLDLSGLNSDFEILGVSPRNSSSISTINGKTTRVATTQWTITLAAKREGDLRIPAFTVNQTSSQAITIKALSAEKFSSTGNVQSAPLLATGLASKASVYPGEQIIYQIELSAATNVSDLNSSALDIVGAKVELFSQQQGQRIDNGVARNIILLKYAVFAEQSGSLQIPSVTFTGVVGGSRSFFGNQGQKVIGRTNPLPIEVKVKPANTKAPWFPAEAVSIRSSWSADPSLIKTGVPVTRTITTTAQAQLASAIPPLDQTASSQASIKSYQDKPTLDAQKTNTGFVATRTESAAIVINSAGEVELPAITVDWFNVNTEKWEQAILPAETITVSGQAVVQSAPIVTPSIPSESSIAIQNTSEKINWLWPVATGLLAFICLIQTVLLIRRKPHQKPTVDKEKSSESEAQRWRLLLKDLNQSDSNLVRSSIIEWLRAANPDATSVGLQAIYESSHDELTKSIKKLEASLFSNTNATELDDFRSDLIQQLESYRKQIIQQKSSRKDSLSSVELTPLYPVS